MPQYPADALSGRAGVIGARTGGLNAGEGIGADPTAMLDAVVTLGESSPPEACPFEGIARTVVSAARAADAIEAARETSAGLIVIRETVPQAEGLAFLAQVRRTVPRVPVVVLSNRRDVDEAILFIRSGARDYLCAPPDEASLERVIEAARAGQARRDPDRFFAPECPPGLPMVGRSEGIREAFKTIRLVVESQCNPALIVGETGTGKELAAVAVHRLRGAPPETFVAVNCATLTANLLESELFGHVKGAFTGADREKTGLFELAEGGSLFLDEISEMPLNLQAKLLRVLQEKQFRKVGGTKTIPCRAMIIASSNRDLAADAIAGRFRKDIYYRLAVFPIRLPPLASPERRDDIPLLAEYFIETAPAPCRDRVQGLSPAARDRLLAHNWPGNVRELQNVVERAMIVEPSDLITPESLMMPGEAGPAGAETDLPVPENDFSLETAERLFITRALTETDWQRTRAAALLGITRATLHAKLKRYKITIPDRAGQTSPSLRQPRRPQALQETRQ